MWLQIMSFGKEMDHLKILDNHQKQWLSPDFNDLCITSILNKLYAPEGVVQNGPKRDVFTNAVIFFRDYLLKY